MRAASETEERRKDVGDEPSKGQRRKLFARDGKSADDLLAKSVANLLRMWADD